MSIVYQANLPVLWGGSLIHACLIPPHYPDTMVTVTSYINQTTDVYRYENGKYGKNIEQTLIFRYINTAIENRMPLLSRSNSISASNYDPLFKGLTIGTYIKVRKYWQEDPALLKLASSCLAELIFILTLFYNQKGSIFASVELLFILVRICDSKKIVQRITWF